MRNANSVPAAANTEVINPARTEVASELVFSPAPVPATANGGVLSRMARRLAQRLKGSKSAVLIIFLSRKLRLTINPRPPRRLSRLTLLMLLPFVPSLVQALPQGAQVTAGQAQVLPNGPKALTVQQSTNKAAIDWRSFSIGKGESVVFNQPNASSVTLNRVLGGNASEIFGSLKANGSVFLMNNAGVYFAPGAAVNTGSFVASTLSMSNQDFMAGNYRFVNDGKAGAVKNDGSISVSPGGYIGLFAPQVSNNGSLNAAQGSVALAAGNRVTLSMDSVGMVNVNVDAAAVKASIDNKGSVTAEGGQVLFSAKSADAMLDTVINTSGTVRATGLTQKNGKIVLDGGSRGVVQVTGQLDAGNAAGKGGSIKVLGDKIALSNGAQLEASGKTGGGEVLVGGNYQGKGPEKNAGMTYVAPQATIKADALEQGDGGKVILWSDQKTRFEGQISAKGGVQGGNGGLVETSGKQVLQALGQVDANAAKGKGGTWLLDPNNITISSAADANVDVSGTVFTSNNDNAIVKADTLSAALTGGATVEVRTGEGGTNAQGGNISVESTVSAAGNGTLVLNAQGNISFTSAGKILHNGNTLNVQLNAGVDDSFANPGTNTSTISMTSGAEITTGGGNVSAVAKGNVAVAGINTGAGSLSIDSKSGSVSQNSALTLGTLNVTATGGDTTLTNSSNAISALGTITATGRSVNLENTATTTQTGILKAATLNLTNTTNDTTLTQDNLLTNLGTIDVGTKNFSFKNNQTLAQTGTLTANTLSLENTAGSTTLNNASNAIENLGTITATGQNFSLTNNSTLTQSGVLKAATFTLDNNGFGATLTKANEVATLGTVDVGSGTFSFKNAVNLTQGGSGITANTLNWENTGGYSDLSTVANSITKLGTVTTSSGGNFSFKNSGNLTWNGTIDAGSNGYDVSLTSASGRITAASNAVNAKNLTIEADLVTLTNFTGTIGSNVTIRPVTVSAPISLNSSNGGFWLDNTEAGQLAAAASSITVGRSDGTGNLGVGGNFSVGSKTLTLYGNEISNTFSSGGRTVTAGTINYIAKNGHIGTSSNSMRADAATVSATTLASGKNAYLRRPSAGFALGASSVTGELNLDVAGAVTQSGAVSAGSLVVSNNNSVNLGTQDNAIADLGSISISSNAFSLKNTVALTQSGTLTAGTLSLTNTGGNSTLNNASNSISALGAVDVGDKTLTLTNTGGALTQSGAMTAGKLVLTNTGGSVTLNNAGNAISDLGTINVGGSNTFTLTNTVATTQSGALTANKLVLTNTTAGTDLSNTSNSVTSLGAIDASGQSFSFANNKAITQTGEMKAGTLNITNTGFNTTLDNSNNQIAVLGDIDATGRTFTLTNTVATTQSGDLKAASLVLTNTVANTDLSTGANEIVSLGTINVGSKSFTLKDTVALGQSSTITAGTFGLTNTAAATTLGGSNVISVLGAVDATGQTFTLKNTTGLTQSGALKAASLVLTNTSGNVTLNTQNNEIASLGTVNVGSGNTLSLKNTVATAQSGVLTAGTLNLDYAGGAATLNQTNAISTLGTVSGSGGAFSLTNGSALTTGSINVGSNSATINNGSAKITLGSGTITASNFSATTSGGQIVQSGALTVTGTSSLNAGASVITLDNSSNDFQGAVSLNNSGNNAVKVSDANTLVLGTSTTGSGALSVTAGGHITQTGKITSTGSNTFKVTAANSDILLASAQNDMAGSVSFASSGAGTFRDIGLRNANAAASMSGMPTTARNWEVNFDNADVTIPTLTLSGNLSVTSGKNITQSAVINVTTGTTTLAGSGSTSAITLDTFDNNFGGAVLVNTATSSGAVKIKDTNAIDFGTSTLGSGTLTVTANGDITQSGAMTQSSGTSAVSFTAGAHAITLTKDNDFKGAVALSNSGANAVAIKDINALSLGTLSVGSSTLSLEAASGISQSSGTITQEANAGQVTVNAGSGVIALDKSNALTGKVVLSNSGANNVALKNTDDIDLQTSSIGSGTLTVTATAGDILQSGVLTQEASAGATSFEATAGKITLDKTNALSGTVSLKNSGANDVKLVNGSALTLNTVTVGSGALNISGTGGVTVSGALTQTGAGAVNISAGNGAISLANAGNDVAGALNLSNSGANAVTVVDKNALDLGSLTLGSGAVSITSGGDLTQSGALTQTGAGAVTVSAGAHKISLDNAGNDIRGSLGLSNSGANDVTVINTGALDIGTSTIGAGKLDLTAKGNVTQSGAITQASGTGAVTVTLDSVPGNIDFSTQANTFLGQVTFATKNGATLGTGGLRNLTTSPALPVMPSAFTSLTLVFDNAALQIPSMTLSGNLSVTSGKEITQASGGLDIGGTTSITAGGAITLLDAANKLAGKVSLNNAASSGAVQLNNTLGIDFNTSTLGSGAVTVTAGGNIKQSGAITQAGAGALSFSAGANEIKLNDSSNQFLGSVSLSNSGAKDVTLASSTALDLGTLNIGSGALSVTAGGKLSQSGVITQEAGAGAASFVASASEIDLSKANSLTASSVSLNNSGAHNVSLKTTGALPLGTVTVGSGTLTLEAGGAISQSGALTQESGAGAVTITTGAAAVTLDNVANNFTGAVGVTNSGSNDVKLKDANGITLGGSNIGGALEVTAKGNVDQNAALKVAGATTVTVDTATNASVDLSNGSNQFGGAVTIATANSGSILDVGIGSSSSTPSLPTMPGGTLRHLTLNFPQASSFVLSATTLSGNLSLTSGGDVSQSGPLKIDGTTTVAAGGNKIILSDANVLKGTVNLSNSGGNGVALNNTTDTILGSLNLGSGGFSLTSTGAITQSGNFVQESGAGDASFSTGSKQIKLDQNNDFTGAVLLTNSGANNVEVKDINALKLGTSSVGTGMLSVSAAGDLSQSGALTQAAGAGVASFTVGGNNISLNQANVFTGAVNLSNSGAKNTSLNSAAALNLGTIAVGSGTVSISSTGNLSQSGSITQESNAGNEGAITITGSAAVNLNQSNTLRGAVGLNTTGSGAVTLNNSIATKLGSSTLGTGTVSITSGGDLSQSAALTQSSGAGAVTVNAGSNAVSLTQAGNDFTGALSITSSGNISVNDVNALPLGSISAGSGSLSLSSHGKLEQSGTITQSGAGAVNIDAGQGEIKLNGANQFLGNVSLNNQLANAVSLNNVGDLTLATSSVGTGAVSITASGEIKQGGGFTQAAGGGAISFNAGANKITLDSNSNQFTGAVSLNNSGNHAVVLKNSAALRLGTSSVGSGSLSITSGGDLDQNGAVTQAASAGDVSISAGAHAIDLTQNNQFTGNVILSNSGLHDVSLKNNADLKLGASSVGSGNLSITSVGALSQSGVLQQESGALSASFSAGANTITLDKNNLLTGPVSLNNSGAKAVILNNATDLKLGASNVGSSTLDITVGGHVQQVSGGITQEAAAGDVTVSVGAHAVDLSGSNDFTGKLNISNSLANNVAVKDSNALKLGSLNVGSGSLSITTGGALTQSGAITQSGAGAVTIQATGSPVTLDNATNTFLGAVGVSNSGANDVQITNSAGITLGSSDVGQNLSVKANGNISQNALLKVGGTLGLTVDKATGANIALADYANLLGGVSFATTNGGSIANIALRNASGSAVFPSLSGTVNNLTLQFDATGITLPALTLTGNLDVNAGGAVQQSAAMSVAGTTTINANNNAILLDKANDLQSTVNLSNTGLNNVTLVSTRTAGLELGTVTVGSGSLSISASGPLSQSGGGKITQEANANPASFSAGANTITLANAGNDFTGAVKLSNSGDKNISLRDANDLILGTSSVGKGTLTITAAGDISQQGAITQAANGGAVSVSAGAHAIDLSQSNDFTGAVSLSNSGDHAVVLKDANDLKLGTLSVGSGTLSISNNGALTQDGTITQQAAAKAVTINAGAGSIALGNANSFTGAVGLNNSGSGSVTLNNNADLVLGQSKLGSGALTVTASGDLSQSGKLEQSANAVKASFAVGAHSIDLSNADNDFTGPLSVSNSGSHNVSVVDVNALQLGKSDVGSGNLSVTSGGALSQSGAITSSGAASFNAGANNISLTDASNNFSGSVSLNNSGTSSASLQNSAALKLGESKVGSGNLVVVAGGAITQSGKLEQVAGAGTASFTTSSGDITLSNANNDFTNPVLLSSAANATVTDVNDVVLGNSTVPGALSVNSSGSISQSSNSAALEVTGTSTFTVSNTTGDVLLGGANKFNNTVTIAAGTGGTVRDVTVRNIDIPAVNPVMPTGLRNLTLEFDNSPLNLPTTSVSGNLTAKAGGDITQSGALTVKGDASFTTGAFAITLNKGGNDFQGSVSLNNSGKKDVELVDLNAVKLGASQIGSGKLTVTAGGDITQGGALVQALDADITKFSAGTNQILLTDAGNDFTGQLDLSNNGNKAVSVVDKTGVKLGTVAIGKDLSVQAGGDITQAQPLTSSGNVNLTIAGATANIDLSNAANNFSGTISIANGTAGTVNNVSVRNLSNLASSPVLPANINDLSLQFDNVGITLPTLQIKGDLNVIAGGEIKQQTSSTLTVGDASSFDAGGNKITLDQANNFTGAVSLKNSGTSPVVVNDVNALILGKVEIEKGNLTVTAGGNISQTGAIKQAADGGVVLINAGANDISLTNKDNDFTGQVSLNTTGTHNALLVDKNSVILGATTIGQNLAVTAGGNISQQGLLDVGGTATFTITDVTGDVLLADKENKFKGKITVAAGTNGTVRNVELRNVDEAASLPVMPVSGLNNLTLQFDKASITLPATTLTGNLVVNAGGDITQGGVLSVDGTASFTAGAHAITLDNVNNDFKQAVTLNNSGLNNIVLNDKNSLILGESHIGKGTLKITTAGDLSQSGILAQELDAGQVTLKVGANKIDLSNAGNILSGALSLDNASGNKDALISNTVATKLAESSIGGKLTLESGGHITQSGKLTVAGDAAFKMNTGTAQNVKLADFENDFAGLVKIENGTGTIADVELRNAHPNASAKSSLILPSNLNNLKLTYDKSALEVSGSTLTGSLEITAGGAISQTGALVVPGTAKFTTGSYGISLLDENNDFSGAVSLKNSGLNAVSLVDRNDLKLGVVAVGSGTLTVRAGGNISQLDGGSIIQDKQAQTATFTAGAHAIQLNNAGNDFTGSLSLNNSGNNAVSVRDSNDLSLANSNLGTGMLTINTFGALTQSGALVQAAGAAGATFTVGANMIKLDNVGNDFNGPLILANNGNNEIFLRDSNLLQLGQSNIGSGALTIHAAGGISQTGALAQEAGAGLTSLNSEAGAISLIDANNAITGQVSLNTKGANGAAISNNRDLTLTTSQLGTGKLEVKAQGKINQVGAIKQENGAQDALFDANANAISLINQDNDFTGVVSLKNSGSGDVAISDANKLMLGTSTVGNGNLTVKAAGGIEQKGAIVQAAAGNSTAVASFDAGTNLLDLSNTGNDFTLAVNMKGGESKIVDKNALSLGTLATGNLQAQSNGVLSLGEGAVSGTLNARSGGNNIVQSNALSVSGNATLDAGAGNITLNNGGNDFSNVDVKAANANLSDTNRLSVSGTLSGGLTTSSAALNYGNLRSTSLTANAGGAITQTSGTALNVSGVTKLDAGTNAITLGQANDFNELEVKAASVQVTDTNALSISATTSGDVSTTSGALRYQTSSVGGNLNATASGAVTQNAALRVTNATNIEAGANAITLTDSGNDFRGGVSLSNSGAGNAISVSDANNIVLGRVKTDGNLAVNAVGISQTAASGNSQGADASGIVVGGDTNLNAGAGAITLENGKNDFVGSLSVKNSGSNAVSVADANALKFGASNVGAGLKAVAAGEISQSDVLVVAGSSSFDAGSNAINLTRANEFGGNVKLVAGVTQVSAAKDLDASLKTTGATTLNAGNKLSVSGEASNSLSLNGVSIAQNAALKVSGNTSVKAGTGGAELTNAGNDFIGTVTVEGASKVSVHDANALVAVANSSGEVGFSAGGALDVSGTANILHTSAVGRTQFGAIKAVKELHITSLGGELLLLADKQIDAPLVSLSFPSTMDLGSATRQFALNSSDNVFVKTGHNGFIQIPTNVKTRFDISPGVGCIRVNLGPCVNGNAVISGAISAVQAGALTGLTSKLAKEDNSTKKITYGFSGDLKAAPSFPHEGALEIRPQINCRTGNTIGASRGGSGFAVENGIECGNTRNGENQEKIATGFTGDLKDAPVFPHEGAIETRVPQSVAPTAPAQPEAVKPAPQANAAGSVNGKGSGNSVQ